jgi:hypothetical protein
MRGTKTISVPTSQLKEMGQVARQENRTLSELIRETFRCYQEREPLPTTLAEALGWVRESDKRQCVSLTRREIDAEISAVPRQQARKLGRKPVR